MNPDKELEEKLRESACTGDTERLQQLVENMHVDINSQNPMNGWTALHWACKRNHVPVVKYLISRGANRNIENNNKELPAQLTKTEEIRSILQFEGSSSKSELPIVPNYLKHPVFPYGKDKELLEAAERQQEQYNHQAYTSPMQEQYNHQVYQSPKQSVNMNENELVLKARVAYSDERDFIEVELSRKLLTYEGLMMLLTTELGVQRHLVYKVRKLPNTIVRNDKDVNRLTDFQEMELVLINRAPGTAKGCGDISDGYKHEQILY